jgi:arsenate reductase
MSRRRFKVLFLCTGNAARSILAEFLLRKLGSDRFEVMSAGTRPRGRVNACVLELLRDDYDVDVRGARSKSWEEYRGVDLDFVITVCDSARESCPVWAGQPIAAHWGSEDPGSVEGDEAQRKVIKRVAAEIHRRVGLFVSLPIEGVERAALEEMTRAIGNK